MPYMTEIKPALIRFGLGPYLEEVPGWETRGSSAFAPACTIGHHTAGPLSGDRPSLNICVNGRAGLPGPLCNDFLSRSKVILVAGGRANHAGVGGFRGLVGNSAAFGNEAESNGVGRKDGSPDWTEFQRWAFPRVHAAHLSVIGRDASWYAGHRDWTSRKIDPTDIDTAALRREIAGLLANPTVEDDMPLTDADIEKVAQRVRQVIADGTRPYGLDALRHRLDMLLGKKDVPPVVVDPKALAAALAAQGVDLGASPEEVASAVVAKMADRLDA